jgi:hypothetical protein
MAQSRPVHRGERIVACQAPLFHETMPISLTISHPDPAQEVVTGFLQLWAYYVRGFNPSKHCQPCLLGRRSRHVQRNATPLGKTIIFDETANFRQLYVCGLAAGPKVERKGRNLHLALKESPGSQLEVVTYNGFTLSIQDGERLHIPEPLPELAHLGEDHYRCCNFRFGVEYYGYQTCLVVTPLEPFRRPL